MHTVLMQRYGGAPGVRDPGALEAALFRPQTGYYDDIVAEAAALLESLAINHPFVDGNKRIAFAAADVFLRINGWCLQRVPMQIYAEMMQMFESGTFDIAHLDPGCGLSRSPQSDAMNEKTPIQQTQSAMTEARAMARNRMPELAEFTVSVESFPSFTKPARQRWESIPAAIRKRLLSKVWCNQCRHETTITNFSGTTKGGKPAVP